MKPGSVCSQCVACEEPITRDRYPPNGRARLTRAAAKGGNVGGGPANHQHTPTACSQRPGGIPQTRQRARLARGQGLEEEGGRPSQQRAQPARRQEIGGGHLKQAVRNIRAQPEGGGRGEPPERQCEHIVHGTSVR